VIAGPVSSTSTSFEISQCCWYFLVISIVDCGVHCIIIGQGVPKGLGLCWVPIIGIRGTSQEFGCQELTTLWVVRLDYGAELKVTDPKEQQGDVEEEEAKGKERRDWVD